MIPGRLRQMVLGRRPFWIYVAIVLAFKIALIVLVSTAAQSLQYLGHLDTTLMLGLAFVVGARFADVGWPRWLGITLVILISFVFPVALVFLQPRTPGPRSDNPMDLMPDLAWVSTLALGILLVIVGVRRSSAEAARDDSSGPALPASG